MSPPPADLVSEIETRVRSASLISLFLDFDGTLLPIVGDPTASCLDPGAAATLKILSSQDRMVTTIISGRAASARREWLERLCEDLALEPEPLPGTFVEWKGLTASVHYRLAAVEDRARIQQAVYAATARFFASPPAGRYSISCRAPTGTRERPSNGS
jgi:trehalose 6-phosphate phosphatase